MHKYSRAETAQLPTPVGAVVSEPAPFGHFRHVVSYIAERQLLRNNWRR